MQRHQLLLPPQNNSREPTDSIRQTHFEQWGTPKPPNSREMMALKHLMSPELLPVSRDRDKPHAPPADTHGSAAVTRAPLGQRPLQDNTPGYRTSPATLVTQICWKNWGREIFLPRNVPLLKKRIKTPWTESLLPAQHKQTNKQRAFWAQNLIKSFWKLLQGCLVNFSARF